MNVCGRDKTDWCSGKEFTACSSAGDRADIMFTVFQAGVRSGVNIQQYQRGQRNLTSITAHGPIRRQAQWTAGSSPNEGYAM